MPLPIGTHTSRYTPSTQEDRDQARGRVISEMRGLVDSESQKSELDRRMMEKAVAELRRKNTY